MESKALKPCPFCGGMASLDVDGARLGTPLQSCMVVCTNCGASLETGEEDERCGEAWNRRAPTPDLAEARAEIGRLRAALEGMLIEWNKFTRYGSPIAKAANERIAAARAALAGEKTHE